MRYDPDYQVYETGVVLGIVFLLFAWPITLGYWLWRGTRNWWISLGLPTLAGLIGAAVIPLWLLGAVICIVVWFMRLQAADERRVMTQAIDEELAFERALEQRRRELGGN